jgi:small conductance mechanosensitive channel
MKVTEYIPKIKEFFLVYGMRVLGALIALIVGWMIIKWVSKFVTKILKNKNVDVSLRPFLISLIKTVLKVLLVVSVASMMGIETTSFIAIIGAAGLAVGLALQGTLANFAGGVLILMFKPYKVGDLIEAQGHKGVVKEIQIFVTKLIDPQNRLVIIPNGVLSNGDIVNYTELGQIRVDLTIGVAYGADLKKGKDALMTAMKNHPKVLETPAPFVGVAELADSSVNLAVRPYCKPQDYWEVYFDIYEHGKLALDAAGVAIPFPQLDVLVKKD